MTMTDRHLGLRRLSKGKHKTHPSFHLPVSDNYMRRDLRHLMFGMKESCVALSWPSGAHTVCPGEVSLSACLLALNISLLQEAAWLSPQKNILDQVRL